MKVVLIDDEYPAIDELTFLLKEYDAEVIGAFTNSLEGYDFVVQEKPEVVFLDIDMPNVNGIDLAIKLQNILPEILIIFVTAYPQYALEAFKAYPLDYILKPIDENRFAKTMEQVKLITNKEEKETESAPYIKCFGKFELIKNNEIIKFPTQKSRELLAYVIAFIDQNIYRDELTYALFGAENKNNANNLRVTLYRLRSTLSTAGFTKEQFSIKEDYTISVEDGLCDYIDFCRFIAKNKAIDKSNVTEAVSIIETLNGEIFTDLDALWIREKSEWVMVQVEELITKTALYYISNRKMQNAEKYLLRLIDIDTLSEQGYSLLLDIYIQTGDLQKYSFYYMRYEKLMEEELCDSPNKKYSDFFKKYCMNK